MKNVILGFFVFALSLPLFFGCENAVNEATSDAIVPAVGTGIVFSGTSVTETGVSWGAARDDVTPATNLSYKVVQATSSAAIDTVAKADAIAGAGLGDACSGAYRRVSV